MPIVTARIHAFYDRQFRNVAGTWPSQVWTSLLRSEPDLDGLGATEFTSADFVEYSRIATTYGSPASRAISNSVAALFASAATMGVQRVATHFGVHSSLTPTAGDMIAWGRLTSPYTIGAGSLVNFPIGSLIIDDLGTA
ncbi:MAG: hypothetical protein RJA36_1269 [Pseudomonadota bacterium]